MYYVTCHMNICLKHDLVYSYKALSMPCNALLVSMCVTWMLCNASDIWWWAYFSYITLHMVVLVVGIFSMAYNLDWHALVMVWHVLFRRVHKRTHCDTSTQNIIMPNSLMMWMGTWCGSNPFVLFRQASNKMNHYYPNIQNMIMPNDLHDVSTYK